MISLKNTMTFTVCALLLMVCAPQNIWASSGYILRHGKTTTGEVDVNLEKNTVVIRVGSNISIFHANNIQKACSFKTGSEEIFYTGSFGMNKPYIFKSLSDGSLPLLYREGVKFSEYDDKEYPPYFIFKDNHIYALGLSKKEIFNVFDGSFQQEMLDFAKENDINIKNQEDLTALFSHYNAITMMVSK